MLAPLVLFILITISFFLIRLAPGDPFSSEKEISPEVRAAFEAKYYLDKPLASQYFHFLGMILQGDLGLSMKNKQKTVNEIISEALPPSLYLGSLALTLALAIGMTAGIIAAVKQNSSVDLTCMGLAVLGISLPTFLIGPLFQLIFSVHFKVFPISDYAGGQWNHMVLPALTLALPFSARIARLMRAGMLDALRQEYIRTAKAKGLPNRIVILRHALRGGVQPVISFLGPAIASITTGSLVVEKIFNLPGLGREFVESAINRDYSLVLGTVILYGTFIIVCNIATDILQGLIDPRVRLS
jgi:oligopeptide transport system permease protein